MDFELSETQSAISDLTQRVCGRFDDTYWLEADQGAAFPNDFHRAIADAGLLGIPARMLHTAHCADQSPDDHELSRRKCSTFQDRIVRDGTGSAPSDMQPREG